MIKFELWLEERDRLFYYASETPLTVGTEIRKWNTSSGRPAQQRFTIDDLRSMILQALGGNDDSKEAYNSPLTQFAKPGELLDRLYSLNSLQQLIVQNPAATIAIEKAKQTNLTVGELAGILLSGAGI